MFEHLSFENGITFLLSHLTEIQKKALMLLQFKRFFLVWILACLDLESFHTPRSRH